MPFTTHDACCDFVNLVHYNMSLFSKIGSILEPYLPVGLEKSGATFLKCAPLAKLTLPYLFYL
ncbi:MAG: hypothetical protein ABI184_06185 [Ginsengibacter sp.]